MSSELEQELVAIAEYVQNLINLEYEGVNWKPEPASALDQAGLQNGVEVVKDYVEHGEAGIAFDHLLYMIKETNLQLSDKHLARLSNVAKTLGASLSYFRTTRYN